ncbi:host attachment protein [Pseudohalocynthiibacter sp. F2068]|jgi:protein required for attachment to host cells|uniref:host attachment protein n=1 Tax=Pseudohalocynthiibacter sp. F2068 TaxID=2926418 RepID=UPI001FF26402|nr:host attachment protein [Pseudohalocynthiibacter sp. F2068]MCK0104228.1 host attachment protein [Pseudohalocynthiibacter sp. F2068]
MKPTVTWVILANAGVARVVVNEGPGKGFAALEGMTFESEPPAEYSDEPGMGHSRFGHGKSAVAQPDPKRQAEASFAATLIGRLEDGLRKSAFDRLILVAAPHMLGTLRAAIKGSLKDKVFAEVAKDLTHIPIEDLSDHLEDVIAA